MITMILPILMKIISNHVETHDKNAVLHIKTDRKQKFLSVLHTSTIGSTNIFHVISISSSRIAVTLIDLISAICLLITSALAAIGESLLTKLPSFNGEI
jgi:hypothetical protein